MILRAYCFQRIINKKYTHLNEIRTVILVLLIQKGILKNFEKVSGMCLWRSPFLSKVDSINWKWTKYKLQMNLAIFFFKAAIPWKFFQHQNLRRIFMPFNDKLQLKNVFVSM